VAVRQARETGGTRMGTTAPAPRRPPHGGGGAGRGVSAVWPGFRGLPTGLQALTLLALVVLVPTGLAVLAGGAGGPRPVEIAGSREGDDAPAEAGEAEVHQSDLSSRGAPDEPDPNLNPQPHPEPGVEGIGEGGAASVDGELEVHFLDVGQADATLLLHDEVAVLLDAGHWQGSDVVPELRARGVDALDLVVVTHPHADHVGQFDQVLDAFGVDEVWWSGSTTTSRTFERGVSALERSTAAYEEPRAGDATELGPLEIEVVDPPAGVGLSDLHDAGLAMRVTYGEVRFLFTGDAEASTEARMTAQAAERLAADVLQLGHHGSRTSTTAAFLSAVDPGMAIYSAGEGNAYGHPHAEVIARVEDAGVGLYGTDVHGAILVTTDGADHEVETEVAGAVQAREAGEDSTGAPPSGSRPAPRPAPATRSSACGAGQVDINSAGHGALQQIIHIGPERAGQIAALRPFADVQALERVSGIGPARLTDIVAQGVACAD
jgi:competence protein ComEC